MKSTFSMIAVLLCLNVFGQSDSVTNENSEDGEVTYEPINPRDVSDKKGYTNERFDVKRFDKKKWKDVIGDEDFAEGAEKKKKGAGNGGSGSAGQRQQLPERDGAEEEPSGASIPIDSGLLKLVVYAIAIAIIAYILVLIVRNVSFRSKVKVPKQEAGEAGHITDVRELEVDRELREALAQGNYRLAIRIYFLGLLKKLDEDGFIAWKKNKTNRDYLDELFSKAYYFEEIRDLTLVYEQIWYGDHTLPVAGYERIVSAFQLIDQKLNATRNL